ncbi:methylated-DNA--[protein]-cysteine S-methyltransferase [Mycobacteroides franklinii]|uniref:methylated-DNA--[protein]-cysteine S-methyltransferase n=1 Tax=Mycobacteroides franklinii TaxID=948102 RepID=UPI0013E8C97B
MTTSIWHSTMETALGTLTLVRDVEGLRGIYFPHHWHRPDPATFGPHRGEGFDDVARQLTEYLNGDRQEFDLDVVPHGDALQIKVWSLLDLIPYGQTITYGELAAQIGNDVTAQQVGAAVGRNPLSIVVPCHRVIGRNGKLTGYAGGIARKQYLLDVERDYASRASGAAFQCALLSGLPPQDPQRSDLTKPRDRTSA